MKINGHLLCFVCHKLEVRMPGHLHLRDVRVRILSLQESCSQCQRRLELTYRHLRHRMHYFPALLRYIQVCFRTSKLYHS